MPAYRIQILFDLVGGEGVLVHLRDHVAAFSEGEHVRTLCLPKSTSVQVRAVMSDGWRRRAGSVAGQATTPPSPRDDGRLCCCAWPTCPWRTRSRFYICIRWPTV